MEREEILRRAQSTRKNKPDEMEAQVLARAGQFAVGGAILVCVALMIVKIIVGQPWYDVYAVACTAASIEFWYKWAKLRRRHEFWGGVAWSVSAIGFAVSYLLTVF